MRHTVPYVLSIFVVLGLSGNRLMYSASAQIVAIPPGFDVLASTYAGDWISNLYHGSVFVGDLDRQRTIRGRIDRMDLIMSGLQAPLFVDPDSNAVPIVPDPLPFTAIYLHRTTTADDSLEYVRDTSPLPQVFFSDASFNDYDNDGDLDVLLAGATRDGPPFDPVTTLWRNDGDAHPPFQRVEANFESVHNGSVDWGDYDNDGDADVLLTGVAADGYVTRIYRNEDSGQFTEVIPALDQVGYGTGVWGDYDNDLDLDILITGAIDTGAFISKIYRNDNGVFTDTGIVLPGLAFSKAAWFDFDSDSRLDILLSGGFLNPFIMEGQTVVLRNTGEGFVNVEMGTHGLYGGDLAVGDYDNDGDLDVVASGRIRASQSTYSTRFFRNDGDAFRVFVRPPQTHYNAFAFCDVDRDLDLDLFITGYIPAEGLPTFTLFYRQQATSNQAPTPPTALQASLEARTVTLSWDPASDDRTPAAGLTYNVRIGTAPGEGDVLSAQAEADGLRWLSAPGNAGPNRGLHLTLPAGTYYWSVQALDASYAGSAFADEQTFEVTGDPDDEMPPAVPREPAASAGDQHVVLTWAANTEADLFQYRLYRNTHPHPTTLLERLDPSQTHFIDRAITLDTTYYYRLTAVDLSGNESDFSPELVATPRRLFVEDGSIPAVGGESAAWGDYDNDGDLDLFVPALRREVLWRNDGGRFADIPINESFFGRVEGTAAWADYDNDGDLDLFTTATFSSSTLFRNTETGFKDADQALPDLGDATAAWGDYDNDGDLDLLLAGQSATADTVAVYRNDDAVLTDAPINLPDDASEQAAWSDYDNDGDLDLLLTGNDQAHIFRNDNATFTNSNAGLEGLSRSTAAWEDYDNDGDLDLLLAGHHATLQEPVAYLYRQDGGLFTRVPSALEGMEHGTAAWGDYDNDGDLDLLLAGDSQTGPLSRLYLNDRNTFFDAGVTLPDLSEGTAAWGDYDGDGDLDLFITGRAVAEPVTHLLRNDVERANTDPTSPTALAASVDGDAVTLSWEPASDAETPVASLTYNVRLGTAPGAIDVLSPMADPVSGLRRLPAPGNAFHATAWRLTGLPAGTYFWSVQAIDHGYRGSAFADEGSFTITSGKNDALTSRETEGVPASFALDPAYPNPFRERTMIRFSLPEATDVHLNVYDVRGHRVRQLTAGAMPAGDHVVVWDGRNDARVRVASGVYVYRLVTADGPTLTRTTTLIR